MLLFFWVYYGDPEAQEVKLNGVPQFGLEEMGLGWVAEES